MDVPEILAAVLEQLDAASLSAAIRVCRAWAPAVIRQLWGGTATPPPPSHDALSKVCADRRPIYAAAMRTLRLTRETLNDVRGCRFPQLRSLDVHYSVIADAAAFGALLDSCGALLSTVTISAQETSKVALATKRSAATDGDGKDADTDDYHDRLDPGVLLRVAQCASLTELYMHDFVVTPAAIERVRAEATLATPTSSTSVPFQRLQRLAAKVDALDAPALLALVPPQSLVGLELSVIASAPRAHVLQALPLALPDLQQLVLSFAPCTPSGNEPSSATGGSTTTTATTTTTAATTVSAGDNRRYARDAYAAAARPYMAAAIDAAAATASATDCAAEFTPLHDLPRLRSLSILGTCFCMGSGEWRAFLRGLPLLEHLHVGLQCRLPPDAFMVAGACCRRLRYLELHMRGSFTAERLAAETAAAAAAEAADSVTKDDLALRHLSGESAGIGSRHETDGDAQATLFPELRVLRLFPPARHFCGNA